MPVSFRSSALKGCRDLLLGVVAGGLVWMCVSEKFGLSHVLIAAICAMAVGISINYLIDTATTEERK